MRVGRYDELTAKVDAFFARVATRHADALACDTGCADCCHARLTVTGVEAAAIRAHVAALPGADRAALHARVRAAAPDRCAALGPDDRCGIYAARPLVCRSHGAPIRLRDPRGLPVVQCCPRNFTAAPGPSGADADCILDQTTLSALLLAVDRADGGDGTRVDLADLLATLTAPDPDTVPRYG